MTKRQRLYPEIRRLREDEGLMWREIGRIMGLSLKTVSDYYYDPDGHVAAARKAASDVRTRKVCPTCGGQMGPRRCGSEQCRKCADEQRARGFECRLDDVAEMYREGMSLREIARELGYGPNSTPPEVTEARRRGLLTDYRYEAVRRKRMHQNRWAA